VLRCVGWFDSSSVPAFLQNLLQPLQSLDQVRFDDWANRSIEQQFRSRQPIRGTPAGHHFPHDIDGLVDVPVLDGLHQPGTPLANFGRVRIARAAAVAFGEPSAGISTRLSPVC
jgi:hypothetical protein